MQTVSNCCQVLKTLNWLDKGQWLFIFIFFLGGGGGGGGGGVGGACFVLF